MANASVSRVRARQIAAGIFGVNLLALAYIAFLLRAGGGAAIDSVCAMVLRTGVWLVLLLMLTWAARASRDAV